MTKKQLEIKYHKTLNKIKQLELLLEKHIEKDIDPKNHLNSIRFIHNELFAINFLSRIN